MRYSRVVMITESLPNLTWLKGFILSVREIRKREDSGIIAY